VGRRLAGSGLKTAGRPGAADFRLAAEASPDCLWILSPAGDIRYANHHAQALLKAESTAGPLAALWPADGRFSLDRAVAAAAMGREGRFRAFFSSPDGEHAYWDTQVCPILDERGQVQDLLAVSRNVTQAVETQAFLQTVIQALPTPLTVKSAQDGRYVLMNRAAEDLFGVEHDEGLGRTAQALLPAAQAAVIAAADRRVLEAGDVVALEFRSGGEDRADATPRYFDLKTLATLDDLGPRHLIAIAEDVTERRRSAESLRAALHDAQQASRAKSAFLANITHEIRTPLNGILAGADILARAELSDDLRAIVATIQASGVGLHRLMSDLLDIAQAETAQPETAEPGAPAGPYHLGDCLREAARPARMAAQAKGLAFNLVLPADLDGPVVGDPTRLTEALGRLLDNAVKFTPAGAVTLAVARREAEAIRFSVQDSGIGFDPADKARLFEHFGQADESYTRAYEGAGLGLALARSLVEGLGGALDCDSAPGQGSLFWFDLALPPATADIASPGEQPQAGLRILLADDHPSNRQVVQMMLAELAEVVGVEDGAQAIETFRGRPFDLVLMDMQMPVLDGLSAVREMRRLEAAEGRARTAVVMLTANTQAEHRAASAAAGADFHLGKPITVSSLFAAVEAALSASALSASASAASAPFQEPAQPSARPAS
jgi:PAS domain S-box-containing protein